MRKISNFFGKDKRNQCQDDDDISYYKNALRGKGQYSQNKWRQCLRKEIGPIKKNQIETEKYN